MASAVPPSQQQPLLVAYPPQQQQAPQAEEVGILARIQGGYRSVRDWTRNNPTEFHLGLFIIGIILLTMGTVYLFQGSPGPGFTYAIFGAVATFYAYQTWFKEIITQLKARDEAARQAAAQQAQPPAEGAPNGGQLQQFAAQAQQLVAHAPLAMSAMAASVTARPAAAAPNAASSGAERKAGAGK